jgi:hypothetical protein
VRAWSRTDWLLSGGAAVALAATADSAWSVYERFAIDLGGLSALERGGVALWDFRPTTSGLFLLGALAVLIALRGPRGRLHLAWEPARRGLVVLSAAHAAFGSVVLGLAVWIAVVGEVGQADELGFVYSKGERAVTLATQVLAYVPLVGLLAALASRAASLETPKRPEQVGISAPPPVSVEMETLWSERLAYGPKRERARLLLGRIRALEAAGDDESARELAEEMRRL